jgi:hypothetical protein
MKRMHGSPAIQGIGCHVPTLQAQKNRQQIDPLSVRKI